MGSFIEIKDTLQITTEQGFPTDLLDRDRHVEEPVTLKDAEGRIFKFHDKPRERIFQLAKDPL